MKKQHGGFTLIELIVVMVIIGLLGAVAVPKFVNLTKKAEAASVKSVLGSVRSALSLKVASGLVNGQNISDWTWNGSAPLNPMNDLLAEKPENYLGVLTTNATANDKGKWYDRNQNASDHWMMYKLKNTSLITGGWNSAGKNIIHRIEDVVENGETVGLFLDTTSSYQYTWNE